MQKSWQKRFAQPIEQQVNGVENMLYMSSTCSSNGTYTLTVTFDIGTDLDIAQILVENRVGIANPLLPEEVKQQGVITQKQSTDIVLIVALTSPDGTVNDLALSKLRNRSHPGGVSTDSGSRQHHCFRQWRLFDADLAGPGTT